MRKIEVHQIDSFADTLFGGNPAGVVTNADSLTDEEMLKIAREMNLSETAFVLQPTSNAADIRIRYFTPMVELKFCGHATIAALYQLAKLDRHGMDQTRNLKVETGAGILEMSVVREANVEPQISFVAPDVEMEAYRMQGAAFTDVFGIPENSLRADSEVLIDRALNYIYIPVASLKTLGDLQFDNAKIRASFAKENTIVFCLYTNETIDQSADLHARVVCPLIGIDEDPFTGSTQSGLIRAAKQNGMIDAAKETIITEQGNFLGRPGFANISHDSKTDAVSVTAGAAHVFSTEMELA